jgi:hypothetical protein
MFINGYPIYNALYSIKLTFYYCRLTNDRARIRTGGGEEDEERSIGQFASTLVIVLGDILYIVPWVLSNVRTYR